MNIAVCCAIVLSLALNCFCDEESRVPQCDSEIYCYGPLLDTIQRAKIYEDSKTFVDMKMKYTPKEIIFNFDEFMASHHHKPQRHDVKKFLNDNFDDAGQEFEDWRPKDWVENPTFLDRIRDSEFKTWAYDLNSFWKILGRKMKDDVKYNNSHYSIIWVPNPVIVPGGRFREFYYWDSYWIVQGLLLCEMTDTVKGMLENFLYIVDTYGHIPNGGRVYYLQRSQPPLMIPMIKLYYDFTKDVDFLKKHIETMEKEYDYWLTKHSRTITVDGVNYTLAAYGDSSKGPRPESYSEDVEMANIFKSNDQKENFYSELKAAAESGWDFSSRWFIVNGTNKGNLTNIKTRSIIPVDLNALIYWNAVLLSEFYDILSSDTAYCASAHCTEKVQYYNKTARQWEEAVTAVLWHEEVGAWLDYDVTNGIKRDYFYPTNIAPLWTGCYKPQDKDEMIRHILKYLQNKNIMSLYPGGIPASVEHTGEQWDYPNAWPPLQHIMIVGLHNSGDPSAQKLAFEMAENWVRSNYIAFKETSHMFEKYDATLPGSHGGGGEYEIVIGFGWTNGIILDLLNRYSEKLTVEDPPPPPPQPILQTTSAGTGSFGQIFAVLIALMISLTAGFVG